MREIRVLCVENHPEYTSALQYMLEKRAWATRCGRSKDVAAEHASSKEKAQNFSVTKVCSPSPTTN
jgi:hypothetical protein